MKSDDFEAFFLALHQISPFPWQLRLAAQVCESDGWPKVIDLPTGAGKTACIDIALFHLLVAAAAGKPQAACRRVAFIVDRRIIVDEAANRARHIATRIADARSGVLHRAAGLLETVSGARSIQVMTLRGGVPREKNLVRDPTTVAIVLSTVDQLGSRLLFRGYGVSDSLRPMHAGMFGCDTLVLLDEAHIAEPFRLTLTAIIREQARASKNLGVAPLRFSQLSATPSVVADFCIGDDDRRHTELGRRLEASKPLRLLDVSKRDELPKAILEQLRIELAAPPQSADESPRIGIVVNRVATARQVFSLLAPLKERIEAHLLIGRIRPIDRDRLITRLAPKLRSSKTPRGGERPIVVVATQTIEVGADFDFHTMFIESASYPAVRQRVGRLNRLGIRDGARGALFLVKADAENDPIYGDTILPTWAVFQKAGVKGSVDLGIAHAPPAEKNTVPSAPETPELSSSLLRLLTQTSPKPAVEPEVSQFLHGFTKHDADVSVVWRNGISDENGAVDETLAADLLDALPPLTLEAMSLPLSSLRAWLRARVNTRASKQIDAGDLEGDPFTDDDTADEDTSVLLASDEGIRKVAVSSVVPGAVIVIPCDWRGTDAYGFAPSADEPAEDLSLGARRASDRAPTLVLARGVVNGWFKPAVSAEDRRELLNEAMSIWASSDQDENFDAAASGDACLDWIENHADSLHEDAVSTAELLRGTKAVAKLLRNDDAGLGLVVRAQRPKPGDLSDDDVGLQRTVEVGLDEHCHGVAEYAARFARRLGLPEALQADLMIAARLHDIGKADPRFQAMLGSDGSRLLAKGSSVDRRVVLGARHECYSVALIDRHPSLLAGADDPGLVRYLVGTHHGRGRGLQPVVEDRGITFELDFDGTTLRFQGTTELAAADSGWPALFIHLQRRYGSWGIAYLETILRLADHRRSEAEVEDAGK